MQGSNSLNSCIIVSGVMHGIKGYIL